MIHNKAASCGAVLGMTRQQLWFDEFWCSMTMGMLMESSMVRALKGSCYFGPLEVTACLEIELAREL